jgi:hypothetical protein
MDWKAVDEKLIRRGELLLTLDFLDAYDENLRRENAGKVGRPYTLTARYVEFLMAVRLLFAMPYRQLEGFTRGLHRLVPKLPSADYAGLRRRILKLDTTPYQALSEADGPITIAVDSTGIRVHKAGGWVERVHGLRKRYVKLHFAVNVETKEVVAMEVTTDDVHDSRVFPALLEDVERHRDVDGALGDGAFDSSRFYDACARRGVEAIVKPRSNSRLDTSSEARRRAVDEVTRLGYRGWADRKGYGRRWMVETAYSTFKRTFGEYCMSKNVVDIERELTAKVYLYNTLINL